MSKHNVSVQSRDSNEVQSIYSEQQDLHLSPDSISFWFSSLMVKHNKQSIIFNFICCTFKGIR